ncbi:uncharacterized protein [Euphorbia lathyris]|uniref:uncharacterized protein n=1 Tax=Euphorbia lathyris TaxID=212925 RepID=UPI0033137ADE
MGCVSSKMFREEQHHRDIIVKKNGGRVGLSHIVSLTSTTYCTLNLDIKEKQSNKEQSQHPDEEDEEKEKKEAIKKIQSPICDDPEVINVGVSTINTWELMEDLEDGVPVQNSKKSPKSRGLILDCDNSSESSSRRRSSSPLFDPELVALYEKELTSDEEQIKTIISQTLKNYNLLSLP